MIDMAPHLTFYGLCREALEFYIECLGGQIDHCITYREANIEVQQDYKDKILTSFFQAQGVMFYASDGPPGLTVNGGGNIALQIESFDKDELRDIYTRLKAGGVENTPLNLTPNNLLYGVLLDKYKISWVFVGLNQ